MLNDVTISNGLVWSPDLARMYYIDSPTRTIQAFAYDTNSGDIGKGQVVITIPEELGQPDGLAIDAAGKLWISEGDFSSGLQWGLIGVQSFLVAGFLTTTTKFLSARQRPYQRQCGLDATYDEGCHTRDSRKSLRRTSSTRKSENQSSGLLLS